MIMAAVPGVAARNGLPAGRPYLSPNQRDVLAVLARGEHVALGDLASALDRSIEAIACTVETLRMVAMLHTRSEGPVTWVVISADGRRVLTEQVPD